MSRIIFLDFDGVIRVPIGSGGWLAPDHTDFCPWRMRELAKLCTDTGAQIVISSDWRNYDAREEIAGHISPHLNGFMHADWMTPICGWRWQEIERWLAAHPEVSSYVILDDLAQHFERAPQTIFDRLVLCSNRHGIVPAILTRTHQLLTASQP